MSGPALTVDGLTVDFGETRAVDRLSLSAAPGEVLVVVGESGSGKSTALHAVAGLLPATARVAGTAHVAGDRANLLRLRSGSAAVRRISMVFQNPGASLNPVLSVGDQLAEVVAVHQPGARREVAERVDALIGQVGLPRSGAQAKDWARAYPHQLSGGQKQRIAIAAALACNPVVLLADEPTTALDATVQAQIVDLLLSLVDGVGLALLFVTHDLPLAASIGDRIAVMKDGRLVESGWARALIAAPEAPYTQTLVDASLPFARGRVHAAPARAAGSPMLDLKGLTKRYCVRGGGAVTALSDVSVYVGAGEIVGLIGESGSGKTTLGRIATGLLTADAGAVEVNGAAFQPRRARSAVQMVFQDPLASFNPRQTIGAQIAHPLRCLRNLPRAVRREQVLALLEDAGLSPQHTGRFAHELSGGQLQRAAIARALAAEPKVLVCDEAVASLDVSIRSQILALLDRLRSDTNLAILFISHDLGVVQAVADRVVVLSDGAIVEEGPARTVLATPQDAYTKTLLASVPAPDLPWRVARQPVPA